MVNSQDTNSSAQSGASISLLKKIAAIFQPKRGAVLRRIYAGLNSDFASPSERTLQIQGMFTPHGISDLKLSPGEIMTLIDSPLTSEKDRKDLITYTQSSEIINDMSATPNNEGVTYATAREEANPPREYYFYCYKYSMNGTWFSTMLYDSPAKAAESMTDKAIIRTKLCCVVL